MRIAGVGATGPLKAFGKSVGATATPAPTEQESAAEIRKAEAVAKARLVTIEAGGNTPEDAPPATPTFEITARLTYARQLVSVYDRQLVALERLKAARERRQQVQRSLESWRGFDDAPPRSVLVIDALRDELDAANQELAFAREAQALFERFNSETAFKVKSSAGRGAARGGGRGTCTRLARLCPSRMAAQSCSAEGGSGQPNAGVAADRAARNAGGAGGSRARARAGAPQAHCRRLGDQRCRPRTWTRYMRRSRNGG